MDKIHENKACNCGRHSRTYSGGDDELRVNENVFLDPSHERREKTGTGLFDFVLAEFYDVFIYSTYI